MIDTLTARDCMTAQLVTFHPDQHVLDAVRVLVNKRISGAPVLDQFGNLVGVLTEQDCLKIALEAEYNQSPGGKVREYMSTGIYTLDIDTPVVEIAQIFLNKPFRRYPVMEQGRLVGIVSRRNVLEALEAP